MSFAQKTSLSSESFHDVKAVQNPRGAAPRLGNHMRSREKLEAVE